jgi:hypothetical protein
MVNRFIVAAAAAATIVGLSIPAFSATTGTTGTASTSSGGTSSGGTTASTSKPPSAWYVAQNDKTMNCIVTPTKPNGTTYMMIGAMSYPTVAAATSAMRAAMECKPKAKT